MIHPTDKVVPGEMTAYEIISLAGSLAGMDCSKEADNAMLRLLEHFTNPITLAILIANKMKESRIENN